MTTIRPELAHPTPFAWLPAEQQIIDLRPALWPIRDQAEDEAVSHACAVFAATALHELTLAAEAYVTLSELSLVIALGAESTEGGAYLTPTFDALREKGQLSKSDHIRFIESDSQESLIAQTDLLWRKARIIQVNRSSGNISKLLDTNRPVLLGLRQMISLSEPDETGIVSSTDHDKPEGNPGCPIGHVVAVVGKAKIGGSLYFLVRNSWGIEWARGGYGFIGGRYIEQHGRAAAIVESIIS